MKVSVITVTFNSKQYIERAIDSVNKQEVYRRSIEIFVEDFKTFHRNGFLCCVNPVQSFSLLAAKIDPGWAK